MFVVAAVPATAAAALTFGLPRTGAEDEDSLGIWAGLPAPGRWPGPTVMFGATAVASGVVVTFLAGAVADGSASWSLRWPRRRWRPR